MATNALRSLWAEPRPTNAPDRGPRDWALVAVFICWSVVEVVRRQNLVLRQDLAPRPLLLLATLAVLGPLLWRRTHPLVAVVVAFGTLTIVDSVRILTGSHGALLEASAVHPGRSARSHLRSMAATHNIKASRVSEVIEMTGLAGVATKRVAGFSLGMGQRLGIAAALLSDPRTLILDEPVNGLDPEGVQRVRSVALFESADVNGGRPVMSIPIGACEPVDVYGEGGPARRPSR